MGPENCSDRRARKRPLTVLDERLRACEPAVDGCHVQGAFAIFTLKGKRERNDGPGTWARDIPADTAGNVLEMPI